MKRQNATPLPLPFPFPLHYTFTPLFPSLLLSYSFRFVSCSVLLLGCLHLPLFRRDGFHKLCGRWDGAGAPIPACSCCARQAQRYQEAAAKVYSATQRPHHGHHGAPLGGRPPLARPRNRYAFISPHGCMYVALRSFLYLVLPLLLWCYPPIRRRLTIRNGGSWGYVWENLTRLKWLSWRLNLPSWIPSLSSPCSLPPLSISLFSLYRRLSPWKILYVLRLLLLSSSFYPPIRRRLTSRNGGSWGNVFL